MKKYVLAIDQSTSATKALLIDRNGKIFRRLSLPHRQSYPQPGWVEHDAEEILAHVFMLIEQLISDVGSDTITAIALANQRETTVLWDRKTGAALCPAIVWQDVRAQSLCDHLSHAATQVKAATGLSLSPYYAAAKAAYAIEQYGLTNHDLCIGTIDSWLIWHFSGGQSFATDTTNASRTQLLNLETLAWDQGLLELFRIKPHTLAESILPSDHIFCHWRNIPVTGVMGDSHAAFFGHGCHRLGTAKATYGTGSSVMQNTGNHPLFFENLSSCVGFQNAQGVFYALEGNVTCSGDTLVFLQELGLFKSVEELFTLANTVKTNGGIQIIPAFSGLGAPYFDGRARGLLCGLSRGSTREEIAYAALLSVVQQNADILECMQPVSVLHADGGASVSPLLMQMQADLLGCPVQCAASTELSALGAAYMAGLTVGFFSSFEDIVLDLGKRYEPCISDVQRQNLRDAWKDAMQRALP